MNALHPDDLQFFCSLATAASLSAAGRELSLSTAAVSKRLAAMEQRLGVQLVARTTRRMGLTPEGELYLSHARKILADVHDLEQLLSGAAASPRGLLRVNATLGFGRSHIAPLISEFSKLHKLVEIQLQLSVNPPSYTDGTYDVCVRFGAPPDSRVIAKHCGYHY